jgi:hypothetical protein
VFENQTPSGGRTLRQFMVARRLAGSSRDRVKSAVGRAAARAKGALVRRCQSEAKGQRRG